MSLCDRHKVLFSIIISAFIFSSCSINHQINNGQIPNYSGQSGSSVDEHAPPEVELGEKIFEELKTQLEFSDNPLIQAYVEGMGERISISLPPHRFEFRYFVIKSDQLNAFALPNGYIFFTERLLNTVKTEDELAFVLSHETAHVMKSHFRRLMVRKSKVDIATVAAMVAGMLVTKDEELMTAVQAFSLGTNQTFFLKYSREFEDEADETGFNYLVQAGYQPEGAVKFMEKLRTLERITIVPPAYLSTHPATEARVYHLEHLKGRNTSASLSQNTNSQFTRFQIWNRLNTEHHKDYLKELQQEYQNNPNNADTLYGLAMIYGQLGKDRESMDFFQKALAQNPKDIDSLRDFGIFYFREGNYQQAEKYLKEAIEISPADFLTLHYLGKTARERNQLDQAIKYLILSKELHPDFPENYYFLGLVYQQKGRIKEAHQNFGDHFFLKGNKKAAQFHFREAAK